MALTARDIMNTDVVTARDGMTVHQLAIVLETNQVSGVPVLDEADGLVGVVSASDIILTDEAFEGGPVLDSDYHSQLSDKGTEELSGYDAEGQQDTLVRDIMSTSVVTAEVDAPISQLAEIMYTRHIHRVIILEQQQLAGIVSTMDILRAVMEGEVA